MATVYTALINNKLNQLLLRHNVNFTQNKAIEIWEVVKAFSYRRINPDVMDRYIKIKDEFVFECSLSNDNNYYLILTKIINVINFSNHIFVECVKEYFHFFFVYKPISKYKDFKGQLYSQDFSSLSCFFTSIESKEIFKEYLYLHKPIRVYYSVNNHQVSNFG